MKKTLGFLFAFMVLAFSIIPCADAASYGNVSHESVRNLPQDHDQDHNDGCSPFCICSCCAGFSTLTKLPSAPALYILSKSAFSSYIPERLYSIALPVWQPPQLI